MRHCRPKKTEFWRRSGLSTGHERNDGKNCIPPIPPYWFYFCDLDSEALTMMTMCLLPNLKGFKRLGEPKAAIEYDPMDLIDFIGRNFVPLNTMMERAGMSETDIYNRTRDVFHHFKLPYDAPPPEE